MEKTPEKLSNLLKDYVEKRRRINPKLSECQIARDLEISNSTFHRMLHHDSYPNVKNLMTLCRFIPKIQTLVTEEMLEVTRESKTGKYIGRELENLLFRKSLFITYALALSAHGVTDEELLYRLGQESGEAIRILTEKGYIERVKGGRYRATQTDKGIIVSFELLKKHIKILASYYNPDNAANNYIHYKIESLNEAGLKKLHDMHREMHRKVQKLMETEEYKGEIPVFSAGFCDMLLYNHQRNKKKEEKK